MQPFCDNLSVAEPNPGIAASKEAECELYVSESEFHLNFLWLTTIGVLWASVCATWSGGPSRSGRRV